MSQRQIESRKASTALAAILPLVLTSTLAFAPGACAADWVERPFDPPAGSRWIIQSDETSEDNRDGHVQTSVMKETIGVTSGICGRATKE